MNPTEAWTALREGNLRFVEGTAQHPSQDAARRHEVSVAQHPFAVVFGCSDSRVAAEIIFDQGLGDTFVVRTAGHVLDTTVVGSIEYGVEVLGASLVVVLGHDHCGAVGAAAHTLRTGEQPPGFVRAVVDRVLPSIVGLTSDPGTTLADISEEALLHQHVQHTVEMLPGYSAALRDAIAQGRCAVVGVQYDLFDGAAHLVRALGDVGESPEGAEAA